MSSIKPWLLFDVDDVLYDFVKSLYLVSQKEGKLRDAENHYTSWIGYNHLEMILYGAQKEFREYMVTQKVLEQPYVIDGAKEFMQWAKHKFSLGFITARGFHPQAEQVTYNFITKHLEVEPDKIIIAGVYGDKKVTYLDHFSSAPIKLFIDDNAYHVQDFIDKNIDSFVFEQNWNKKELLHLPRINNYIQLRNYLELDLDTKNMPEE